MNKLLVVGVIVLFLGMSIPSSGYKLDTKSNVATIDNQNLGPNPYAIIETSMGTIKIELFKDLVPNTVNNFINLTNISFYNGLVFHRVIDDFVIQGGGFYPNGTHKESPFGPIDLEIHPKARHVNGAIGMARTSDPNSATNQFYICDGPQHSLDDNYAVFGRVTFGTMSVVRDIAKVETTTRYGMEDWPVDDIIINSLTIKAKSSTIARASPLFAVRSSRAIDEESNDIVCDYVGKGKEITILLPTRDKYSIQKFIDVIGRMDDETFNRFIALVISRLNQDDKIKDVDIQDIINILHRLRTDELKDYIIGGNENDFYNTNDYTFGKWFPGCFLLMNLMAWLAIFVVVIFAISFLSTCYWTCDSPQCD